MYLYDEFDLLDQYLKIYIQLLPYCIECGGMRIHKPQLPTFEYFKEMYYHQDYSLVIPHFKESRFIKTNDGVNYTFGKIHVHGLESYSGIGYRYYNYWMGCKYFLPDNVEGNYTINEDMINSILKTI